MNVLRRKRPPACTHARMHADTRTCTHTHAHARALPPSPPSPTCRSREQLECVCLILPHRDKLERRQTLHTTERRRSLSFGSGSPSRSSSVRSDMSVDTPTGLGLGSLAALPLASPSQLSGPASSSSSPSSTATESRLHTILGQGHAHFDDVALKINLLRNSVLFNHCDIHDLNIGSFTIATRRWHIYNRQRTSEGPARVRQSGARRAITYSASV